MTRPRVRPRAEASTARRLERAKAKTARQAGGKANLSGATARGAGARARCQLLTTGQVTQEGLGTLVVSCPGSRPMSLGFRQQRSHLGRQLHKRRLHGLEPPHQSSHWQEVFPR